MAWTDTQRKLFLIAATAAGWNDAMRHVALASAGCPKRSRGGAGEAPRASIKDPRNSQRSFDLAMELAEGCARQRGMGDKVPRPRHHRSWSDACADVRTRTRGLIDAIAGEAVERTPGLFNHDFLPGFIERMTKGDDPNLEGVVPATSLSECSGTQLYRILEGLKAWVGREFARGGGGAGITPRSFDLPKRLAGRAPGSATLPSCASPTPATQGANA